MLLTKTKMLSLICSEISRVQYRKHNLFAFPKISNKDVVCRYTNNIKKLFILINIFEQIALYATLDFILHLHPTFSPKGIELGG